MSEHERLEIAIGRKLMITHGVNAILKIIAIVSLGFTLWDMRNKPEELAIFLMVSIFIICFFLIMNLARDIRAPYLESLSEEEKQFLIAKYYKE